MPTPKERRRIRLKNDYSQMTNLRRSSLLDWNALEGQPPYVEKYELTVHVCTIISPDPSYRETHCIHLTAPSDYPKPGSPPKARMQTSPPPFHPNWFTSGRWCVGSWKVNEGLGEYTIRMIRTLQFDPTITNEGHAANTEAASWYREHKNSGLFPCDNQTLPDPTESGFVIVDSNEPGDKKFDIES